MNITDKIKVTNDDCMELMARYRDNHFDLAIVDPPYGIKADGHRANNRSKLAKSKEYNKALWEQSRPSKEYFKELFRVSKNQVIWGANHLCDLFDAKSTAWLVWDKNNSGNFADCELAYTSFDHAVRIFKYTWNGMIQENMKDKEIRIHPTQKPVALYKWVLKKYCLGECKVLDTHHGSGSISIACHDLNIDIVACEIEEGYYHESIERILNHVNQQILRFD